MEQQEGPCLILPVQLAQRVMDYIRNSPSPMAPVREAMDIIQRISNLPRADPGVLNPKKPAAKKPAAKKPISRSKKS